MGDKDILHPLTKEHYRRSLMGTNNTIFNLAHTAPFIDKKRAYSAELKQAMEWPDWINCDYDIKNAFGVYERLYQFTIISLCCDIEFFFKALFLSEKFKNNKFDPRSGKGYYQRFSDVVSDLKGFGIPLGSLQSDLESLTLAFSIRHIAIHNFGLADSDYIAQTKSTLNVGDHVVVNQEIYLRCSGSYRNILRCIDQWLAS